MKGSSSKPKARKARLRIEPEAYYNYMRGLELKSLRLCRLEANLLAEPSDLSKFSIEFVAQSEMEGADYAPRAVFTARILDGEHECVRIVAEYCARFATEGPPPEGFDEVFFQMNLSRMAYPFFREVVATTTARMDLPTLLVPLNIFGPDGKPRREKKEAGE